MPYAWLSVEHRNRESRPVMALLDTGSAYNVLSMEFAAEMLEVDEGRIRSAQPRSAPAMGGKLQLYPWKADIRLRASQVGGDSLLVRNTWIFVTDQESAWPALFGQLTGFEEKWFRHHNHSRRRFWQLSVQR